MKLFFMVFSPFFANILKVWWDLPISCLITRIPQIFQLLEKRVALHTVCPKIRVHFLCVMSCYVNLENISLGFPLFPLFFTFFLFIPSPSWKIYFPAQLKGIIIYWKWVWKLLIFFLLLFLPLPIPRAPKISISNFHLFTIFILWHFNKFQFFLKLQL